MNKAKLFIGPVSSGKSRIVEEISKNYKNPFLVRARGGVIKSHGKYLDQLEKDIFGHIDQCHDLLIIDDLYFSSMDWFFSYITSEKWKLNHIGREAKEITRPDLIFIIDGNCSINLLGESFRRRFQVYDLSQTPYEELHAKIDEISVFERIGGGKKNFLKKNYSEFTEEERIKVFHYAQSLLQTASIKESHLENENQKLREEIRELKSIIEWTTGAFGERVNPEFGNLTLKEFIQIFDEESGLRLRFES